MNKPCLWCGDPDCQENECPESVFAQADDLDVMITEARAVLAARSVHRAGCMNAATVLYARCSDESPCQECLDAANVVAPPDTPRERALRPLRISLACVGADLLARDRS